MLLDSWSAAISSIVYFFMYFFHNYMCTVWTSGFKRWNAPEENRKDKKRKKRWRDDHQGGWSEHFFRSSAFFFFFHAFIHACASISTALQCSLLLRISLCFCAVILVQPFSAGETLCLIANAGAVSKVRSCKLGLLDLVYLFVLSGVLLPVFRFYHQDAVLFESNIHTISFNFPKVKIE